MGIICYVQHHDTAGDEMKVQIDAMRDKKREECAKERENECGLVSQRQTDSDLTAGGLASLHLIPLEAFFQIASKASRKTHGQRGLDVTARTLHGHENGLVAICGNTLDFNAPGLHLPSKAVGDVLVGGSLEANGIGVSTSRQPGSLSASSSLDLQTLSTSFGVRDDRVGIGVCLSLTRRGLNLSDLESTLFLLDAIGVLSVQVGGLDLGLKRTSSQFVHGAGNLALELTIDDGQVLEDDTVFEGCGVEVVHGACAERVEEG